ncbi:hypothetical protein ACFE04_006442 [Oxalis oulophora]
MKGLNKNYQALIFSFLVALLIITPILSSSIRSTYLYFIINLVIIALGAESGLLSFVFSKPPPPPPPADHQDKAIDDDHTHQPKTIQKSVSEKVTSTTVRLTVKKSPSMPSIFFIGGGEASMDGEGGDTAVEEQDEELVGGGGGGVNGHDQLFTKAENFIGNFYKQLKMQRQDSWNRIHGFYQKAF